MSMQRRSETSRRGPDRTERPAGGSPPLNQGDAALPFSRRWLELVLKTAVIVLAVAWIYSPVCNPTLPADWLWDDDQLLTNNLTVQHRTSPDPRDAPQHLATLGKLWNPLHQDGADYFPLSYTALWAQWPFFQMDPRTGGPVQPDVPAVAWPTGFHVTTVVLHLLGALALWRLFSVMKLPGAWLAALLFAVHPVCVESVAWVSELKNTLSLPLFLLAAISYVHFDDLVEAGREQDDPWVLLRYGAAIVFFLLAMFAKTSVVAFPVVLLVYAWWKRNRVSARDLVFAAPFFLISLVLGALTVYYQTTKAIGQETIVVPSLVGDGSANYREGGVKVSSRSVEISGPDGRVIHKGPLQSEADFAKIPLEWRIRVRDLGNRIEAKDFPAAGRVRTFDDPANTTVVISAMDGRTIYAGPLRDDADLAKVPDFVDPRAEAAPDPDRWRRRVAGVNRGIGMPSLKGFLSRCAIAGTSTLFYLGTIFWPVNLLPIYTRWDIDRLDLGRSAEAGEMLFYLLPVPVILGAVVLMWINRATWGRHVLFACMFFLLMVAPVLGFVTISYMRITWAADHFIYLPMIAIIGLLTAGVGAGYRRCEDTERPLIVAGVAFVVAVLSLLSFRYAACWVNEDALWTHTLTHNENAWQAHNRLGAKKFARAHVEDIATADPTTLDKATRVKTWGAYYHFTRSTALRPDLGETHNNLGTAYSALAQKAAQFGKPDDAAKLMSLAIEQFAEACRVTPHVPAIHVNLANALAAAGRFKEAAAKYLELVQGMENTRAEVIARTGNPQIPYEPSFAAMLNNYGVALYKSGQKEESIVQFRRALEIAPGLKDAQESLAVALGERPDPSAQLPPTGTSPPPAQPGPPPLKLEPPKSPTLGPTIQ